jgi:hypothetical protein
VIIVAKTCEACIICDVSILRRTNSPEKDASQIPFLASFESQHIALRARNGLRAAKKRENLGSLPPATSAQQINRGA